MAEDLGLNPQWQGCVGRRAFGGGTPCASPRRPPTPCTTSTRMSMLAACAPYPSAPSQPPPTRLAYAGGGELSGQSSLQGQNRLRVARAAADAAIGAADSAQDLHEMLTKLHSSVHSLAWRLEHPAIGHDSDQELVKFLHNLCEASDRAQCLAMADLKLSLKSAASSERLRQLAALQALEAFVGRRISAAQQRALDKLAAPMPKDMFAKAGDADEEEQAPSHEPMAEPEADPGYVAPASNQGSELPTVDEFLRGQQAPREAAATQAANESSIWCTSLRQLICSGSRHGILCRERQRKMI